METKIGFLETFNVKANRIEKSNSRMIADVVVYSAIVLILMIAVTSCKVVWATNSLDGLIGAAAAVGTAFVTVAGSAMYFLFNQKKTEERESKQTEIQKP